MKGPAGRHVPPVSLPPDAGRLAWQVCPAGVQVDVRLTPKAARDALDGVESLSDGRPVLKGRVRAVPEDGKANAALCQLVAQSLQVAASRVSIASGATARVKRVLVEGDSQALAERLVNCLASLDRQGHLKAL